MGLIIKGTSIFPVILAKLQYFTNLDFPEIRPVVGGSPTTLPFRVRSCIIWVDDSWK